MPHSLRGRFMVHTQEGSVLVFIPNLKWIALFVQKLLERFRNWVTWPRPRPLRARFIFRALEGSVLHMGGATGGCWGQCPPLLGPGVYRGYRGRSNENDLCFFWYACSAVANKILSLFYSSLYSLLYRWLNFNSPDSSRHLPS